MAEAVNGLQDLALTWSGRAMDVARIETELDKLRYLAAGEPGSGEGFALRASVLNMVVYAEQDEHAEHAIRVIEDLAGHHPSRVVLVIGKPSDDESHISAQLAAHCHISRETEQTVCCEEVTLRVSGRAAGHLHSLVAPLLIPDLPVYVWWTEPLPDETHQIQELLDLSHRLIIDSALFGDQLAGLGSLLELVKDAQAVTIGDLNWARLSLWRQLLQQQRQVQEVRHHMEAVDTVEVSYGGSPFGGSPVAQSYLFLGWLAEELGWDLSQTETTAADQLVVLGHRNNRIRLYTKPVDYAGVEPGSLVGVRIACLTNGKPAVVSVARTTDPLHLSISTKHAGRVCEELLRAEEEDLGAMLTMELDALGGNRDYRQALENAVILSAAAGIRA